MELTLTVHVPRRRPLPVEVVVEWAGDQRAADLCRALAEHLGEAVPGLTSRGQPIGADAALGLPPLVHGASVAVAARSAPPSLATSGGAVSGQGLLELVVAGGPDAGRSRPLLPPGLSVGRAPEAGLTLADDALSRVHAVLDVGPAGVTVVDAGSTNGVQVDGALVSAATAVDATSTIVLGSSTLRLRRVCGRGLPVERPGDGTLRVRPTTRAQPEPGPVEIRCSPPPPDRHRVRIPWVAALVPVPVGVALAYFLGPYLLVFALMGPLVLLTSALGDRWGSGRSHRRALDAHARDVAAARRRLRGALAEEAALLHRAHPDPHTVLTTAEGVLPGLWATAAGGTGGTAAGTGIPLRLGTGAVVTRVAWLEGAERTHPLVDDAPVVVDLARTRGLGVVGPPGTTAGHLRMLVGQLCTTHPPDLAAVGVVTTDDSWAWVGLLPHHAELTDLLLEPGPHQPGHRVLVVPDADAVEGGVSALVTRALDAGVHVIVAATERSGVPGGVGAVVAPASGARHVLVTGGSTTGTELTLDLVGAWWADRVARALAPLRPSVGVGGALPAALTLADALGRPLTSTDVAARWRGLDGRPSTPEAVVGLTPEGPFSIDLVRDGPHVLVGGTTGSGKSEFLRTLVTSLAISCPPDELTFVLVDFKGGAAFGPCAALPHVVGLVTDLDDHLVARALRSLGAELRRRERVLAAAGAGDLDGYRRVRAPGSENVPRLVVVIDELKALVDEVPDFVSGLVRLAALGRSLGVHLVLATQRPAGAVTAEIQANVNLRIAFRMRDRADSVDVLEDPAAAAIRSSTPGRALSRGGDGTLVTFQAATVVDDRGDPTPHLTVRRPGPRPTPAPDAVPVTAAVAGSAVSPVVEAVRAAHVRLAGATPRAPWLPPLPSVIRHVCEHSAAEGGEGDGSDGSDGSVGAVVGLLDEPELQRVSPLVWTPGDGTWLLSGRPGSGRSTALRTVCLALAARLGPDRLHLQVIDPTGSLADLDDLPHLGTRIGPFGQRGLSALLRHLRAEVESRRSSADRRGPLVLVVVDGWEQLAESEGSRDPGEVVESLFAILRDGPTVGVVGIVSGGRSLLQPRWSGVGGCTLLLGAVDPLDAALAGLRLADLPRDPPPGRVVRPRDRREAQVALSTSHDTQRVAADLGARHRRRGAAPAGAATPGPWRWRDLPRVARRPRRPDTAVPGHAPDLGLADDPRQHPLDLGLAAPCHDLWQWSPDVMGRRLLVAGPGRSGRSTTLATIACSALAAGHHVALVLGRPGDDERLRLGNLVTLRSGDVDALVDLRRRHPDLVVLVDDVDHLGEDAPVLPVLREVVELVDRDRGLVAVSTTSSTLATRFRGLDVEVARHRVGVLLNPDRADGDLLGARLREAPPRVPGRGVAVVRGEAVEVQVFLAEGSG